MKEKSQQLRMIAGDLEILNDKKAGRPEYEEEFWDMKKYIWLLRAYAKKIESSEIDKADRQ
jgi:hypothetical protein